MIGLHFDEKIALSLIKTITTPIAPSDNRSLLRFYCYYRLFLAVLFSMLFWLDATRALDSSSSSGQLQPIIGIYFGSGIAILVGFWLGWLEKSRYYIVGVLAFDVTTLVLIMHNGGNPSGGVAYLLLVSMAIGSLLTNLRMGIALAAFTSLLLVGMTTINVYKSSSNNHETIFSAGILGFLLFATVISFRWLAVRIQLSQQAAQEEAQKSASLQKLTQQIVKKMRTGLVVLDPDCEPVLANSSAKQLINNDDFMPTLKKQLDEPLKQWQEKRSSPEAMSVVSETGLKLKVSFGSLDDHLILFIEDTKQLTQEAQQLKLASLGRLTASIAHEIRNPLGAISHASQLLSEDEHDEGTKRLLEIIQNHSHRIDHIINNILQLSRRKIANPEIINLPSWLDRFKTEYLRYKSGEIITKSSQEIVLAKVDPSHLDQVINNLVDNGLRYGAKNNKEIVTLKTAIDEYSGLPYIDIIDEGDGISEKNQENIFEPFFTTEVTGSGLGLYLCKELCEANQANLSYGYNEEQKSCFHLQLSHHQRNI